MKRTNFISSNLFLLLITLIFLCIFFYSNKIYAYNCYDSSNAGSVAPSNAPTACADMYIVPTTVGAGAKK